MKIEEIIDFIRTLVMFILVLFAVMLLTFIALVIIGSVSLLALNQLGFFEPFTIKKAVAIGVLFFLVNSIFSKVKIRGEKVW